MTDIYLLESVVRWIVEALVASTLLLGLVMLARKPVARHFGPGIAYALWAIPALRLVMPPLPELSLGGWMTVPRAASTVSPMVNQALFIDASAPAGVIAPAAVAVGAVPEAGALPWGLIAFGIWALVAVVFLVWQIARYRRDSAGVLASADDIDRSGPIALVRVPGISSPFAFGLLDRFIALPSDFETRHGTREREMILAHESAHHRAGDLWANAAALIFLSLHWFNPLAWMAWRRFRLDQESACDARVLKGRGPFERALYGTTIAQTATGRALGFAAPLNLTSNIKERLRLMTLTPKGPLRRAAGSLLLGLTGIGALAFTATAAATAADAVDVPTGKSWTTAVATHAPGMDGAIDFKRHATTVRGDPETWPDTWAASHGEEHQIVTRVVRRNADGSEELLTEDVVGVPAYPMPPALPAVPAEPSAVAPPAIPAMPAAPSHAGLRTSGSAMALTSASLDCAGMPSTRTIEARSGSGRQVVRVAACDEDAIERHAITVARDGMLQARRQVAANRAMHGEIRDEVLRELDQEIADMERDIAELRRRS